jgi:hypothetical protein
MPMIIIIAIGFDHKTSPLAIREMLIPADHFNAAPARIEEFVN